MLGGWCFHALPLRAQMKSVSTFALIFLFSSIVATALGWEAAEYAMLSSRNDILAVIGGIFVVLFGLLLVIFVLARR